jgi:hypothetical protein
MKYSITGGDRFVCDRPMDGDQPLSGVGFDLVFTRYELQ